MIGAAALDGARLLNDASSLVVAALVLIGAVKVGLKLRSDDLTRQSAVDERIEELRDEYERRLDRLRHNQTRLVQHAGELSRKVPIDIEQPAFPKLLPELSVSDVEAARR